MNRRTISGYFRSSPLELEFLKKRSFPSSGEGQNLSSGNEFRLHVA